MMHRLLLPVLIAGLPLGATAQTVPDTGLRAEMQGQWADAVEIYKATLKANPAQAHLWERVADIRATQLKDPARAAEALREAVKYASGDARLHHKLAQAYATTQNPAAALAAIERAIALDPSNVEYLRTRADLAAWQDDYPAALESQRRILALAPNDAAACLGAARVLHWQGELDASAQAYRDYLATQPDAAAARMEYIVVVTELGDYARAMELLDDYRKRYGDDVTSRKQRARVLAWADRPASALTDIAALEQTLREDYELGYTRTVALHYARRPREALGSLAEVARLRPDAKETRDLTRFIRTPLRSNATVDVGYQSGSDNVSGRFVGLRGEYVLNPETRLFAGTDRQRVHAESGSGYEKPDGGTTLNYTRAWLGVQHRASPAVSLDAQIGGGRAEGDGTFIYEIGADLEPRDDVALRLAQRQDLFTASPRSAKLDIERRSTTLDATWTPDLRWTLASRFGYDTLSDGNDRWEATLAPRRAVLRTQRVNLDLGVNGRWFAYDEDPGNGYYAPSRYARYAVTFFSYWKLSDDDGVSVAVSYGPYKDNTMSGYRAGGDVFAEGFFGLYRDWFLDVRAGWSRYGGGETSGYRSRMFELSLTHRF